MGEHASQARWMAASHRGWLSQIGGIYARVGCRSALSPAVSERLTNTGF